LQADTAKLFLTCMIREGDLSKKDIDELQQLIAGLAKGEA
jgi:hypothetical protein